MSTSIPSAASTLSSHQQQQYHQNQVFNWLDDLNLTHLFHKFIDNGYEELGLCVKIGESDLNAIGIQEPRERKAILQAVRQLQYTQQRSTFPDGNGSSSKTLPGVAKQPSNSFLKALSPTRRRCPELAGTESSSADPRCLSQLGAGNTWDRDRSDPSGEVELQELRYHFQQTHSNNVVAASLSSAHVPTTQNASTGLSSFFRHKKQQQQHHHHHQNSYNELIQNSRRNGGAGNGLGHQQQQQSILIVGGRTLPFHPTGKDFVSADDIHDSTDVDDDNGDYSECTDLDLILSAQRTCSSHINHTTRGEHGGGDRFSPLVVEHCDCGFFEHQQNSSSKNYQQTEDDEPFYESVSPQPPALKSQRPHGHPIPTKYQVPLPLPPSNQLGLNNYTNGIYKLENNNSQNCPESVNSFGNNKASDAGGSDGGVSAYNNDIQTHANFVLRSQLRDHIIHAKINLAQLPDETTLRAMAAKYASELSYTSSPGAPNNPGNTGAIGKSEATRPNATSINSTNWAAQGLPLLEFQQHVLHQLREIWLEERRKLVSDIDDCGINLLSPNSCSSSANFYAAVNPSSIFSNDSSSGSVAAGNLAEFQFPSCGSSTTNSYVSGDQQQKQQHNLVGGYFNPSPSSPNVSSGAGISVFSSHFSSNTSNNRNKSSMNNGGLEKCVGGGSNSSNVPALNSSDQHRQRHDHSRGTPKQSNSGNANHQQQRHQYLEPVIITNSPSTSKHHNQLHKYQPPPPLATISGFGYDDDRQSYTPGIYQPSSCLRDKDEIYDYIPPRGHLSSKQLEQISPLSKRSGGSRFQSTMSLGTMRHHNHSKCLSNFIKTSDNTHKTSRTLLHHHQHQQTKDKTYGFFREVSQTSPRRNNHNFSTIRLLRGTTGSSPSAAAASRNSGGAPLSSSASTMRPTSSSMSSYTISGSCSSSNSNNSNGTSSSNSNNAYGFPSFNHIGALTSEIEDYSRSPGANTGCRTLANLSKLSRRLGLNRFFRPLRHNQQGHHPRYHHQNSSADRQHYFTSTESSYWVDTGGGVVGTVGGGGSTLGQPKRLLQSQPLLLTSPDSSAATSSTAELSSPNGSGSQQRVPNTNEGTLSSKSKASGYQGLVSLPSNERIIETINRLKYEELQRRKERIAQEHRMIIRGIRESMSHRNGSSLDVPSSSVYYVTNEDETGEDGDERGYNAATDAASLFRLDSSSSLKIPHAYENIGGTSSGSEFGNNGTLEKREKTRHNKGRSSSSSSGRNKFGFGSVGNLEESCEEGDLSSSLHSKAISSSNAKAKSTSGSSRRCTASDQNLNDGFKLEEGASGGGEDNELENENEFGPQSLFITTNRVGVGHSFGTVSCKEQPRKGNRIDGGPHLDRRIIGAFESTLSSKTGTGSSNGGGVISGQEISGSGGNSTNNGWQLDGNTVVAPTSAAADDTAVSNNRSSYASTTSRASTSSESFSEIFARNLKRTFKSNQAKAKFAIPRATTSHSYTRPSSIANIGEISPVTTHKHIENGERNHFYYLGIDSFSDAVSNTKKSTTDSTDYENGDLTMKTADVLLSSPAQKKKGPTPPPKPKSKPHFLHKSTPELHQMADCRVTNILNPCSSMNETHADARCLYRSFESIASYPPPPPKHVRSANIIIHQAQGHPNIQRQYNKAALTSTSQSVEVLPSISSTGVENHGKLLLQHQHTRPMSLSEFMKLSCTNSVLKKLQPSNITKKERYARSKTSPTPSVSSGGGGDQTGASRQALTFRRKCGVTKRRKKIDESLFAPASTDVALSCSTSNGQNKNNSRNNGKHNRNGNTNSYMSVPPPPPPCSTSTTQAVESSRYSITAEDPDIIVAEINHDTEFELDPLPEKDSDDHDFNWVATPKDDGIEDVMKRGRKVSNAVSGNGRPSSRCSLIINSLMGHLSGLTKNSQEPQQGPQHAIHHSTHNNNNNNNFDHLEHAHDHANPSKLQDDRKKKGHNLYSRFSENKQKMSTGNGSIGGNLHHHTSKSMGADDDNDITTTSSHSRRNVINERQTSAVMAVQRQHADLRGKWLQPRSLVAFNMDIDYDAIISLDNTDVHNGDEITVDSTKLNGKSAAKNKFSNNNSTSHHYQQYDDSGSNITHHDSFPTHTNVIGCIPRVSLSNVKKVQQLRFSQQRGIEDDEAAYHRRCHPKPQFAIGGVNIHNNNQSSVFQERNNRNYVVSSPRQQQHHQSVRCGGGLFGVDTLCCDKFDKYYGEYSLTGLNIPNTNIAIHSNTKSAEELVLDRYYAHCNNTVASNKKEKPSGERIFKGKRTYSLPEKLWKNVSHPLINSNRNNNTFGSTLCGHHKAKQIEECYYCVEEQQQQKQQTQQHRHSNRHLQKQNGKTKDNRKKTDLFHLEPGRDFLGTAAGRLIKLKKLGKNKSEKEKNVKRFQEDVEVVVLDDAGLSSSSSSTCSSSFISSRLRAKQKLKPTSAISSVCLNSTSNSDEFDDSAVVTGKRRAKSCSSVRDILYEDAIYTDEDLCEGQGQLTVKVKASHNDSNKNKEANNPNSLRRTGGSHYNHHGASNEEQEGTKEVRIRHKMYNSSSTRAAAGVTAMNPIITAEVERVIEDSSSISSLPISSHGYGDAVDEKSSKTVKKNDSSASNISSKRNRVKWMFLTSGFAKATRKLSASSSLSTCDSSSCSSVCTTKNSDRSGDFDDNEKQRKATTKKSARFVREKRIEEDDVEEEEAAAAASACKNTFHEGVNKKHNNGGGNSNPAGVGKRVTSINTNAANALSTSFQKSSGSSSSRKTMLQTRTSSLRRRPSYSANKKQRPITIQVVPSRLSSARKHGALSSSSSAQHKFEQADATLAPNELRGNDDTTTTITAAPTVFLRKRFPLTLTTRTTASSSSSGGVAGSNNSTSTTSLSIFSATSTTSSTSSTASSTRSSSSGYTSNVSKRTTLFFKSFRKRFVKKNNKIADGDEEDAHRSQHDNYDDEDDDHDNREADNHDSGNDKVQNTCNNSSITTGTRTSRNKRFGEILSRRASYRRTAGNGSSRASKAAILSTFYIGPDIKDPVEEEKLYVTKDFDDVVLDLKSGEVKKTCDGTILFTTDPLCFASKKKHKKSKKVKEKLITRKNKQKSKEACEEEVEEDDDDGGGGSSSGTKSSKKSNSTRYSQSDAHEDGSGVISKWDANNCKASLSNSGKGDVVGGCEAKKSGVGGGNENNNLRNIGGYMKKKNDSTKFPSASGEKSRKTSRGLIKSYLGISKDLLGGATTGKNQSAEDVSGGGGDENLPETPTRGSSGILGRLRDSSRSGFGFSSSSSYVGGNGESRSSSKKRSLSRHDNVNTQANFGIEVSQTDSPTQKSRNSLLDSLGPRGSTDDANDQEGVAGKLSTGHHTYHQASSSEEELTSINSCDNRLSSLTLAENGAGSTSDGHNGAEEYNGPFQGRGIALVNCTPSPYDRHALRYKKDDIIDIISKKRTGLWTGKVNNQIGYFKFMNIKLIPSTSSTENYDEDNNQEDEQVDDDADDSAADYAETSNYQCSLHYAHHPLGASQLQAGESKECCCSLNDPGVRQYHGSATRLAEAVPPWELAAKQRQNVANMINGYDGRSKDKRQKQQRNGLHHGDASELVKAEHENEEDDEDDDDAVDENEEVENEEDEDDVESGDEVDEDDDETEDVLEVGEGLETTMLSEKGVKNQKTKSGTKAISTNNKEKDSTNSKPFSRKKKQSSSKMGPPKTVEDLLQRINLEKYTHLFVKVHGFESLEILEDLEEEDLDRMDIGDPSDRHKILTTVAMLKDDSARAKRIPGPNNYTREYYETKQKTLKHTRDAGGSVAQHHHQPSPSLIGVGQGSPALQSGMQSPHFYRLHHPRDSGIFVGKVDGDEDGDEPISGADLSCAESHPDVETEEIILSPINLAKTSSVVTSSVNPNSAAWHQHHHNNNKQGSHHHINRFISKGGPSGIIIVGNGGASSSSTSSNASGGGPVVVATTTAQQPSSSSSSGSSSSGIATTGDSFWQCTSSNNSNGSGPGASSIVVDQNHSQWSKQQQTRESSPAYNTDSVRNRFLQAKSLFETSNNCSGSPATNTTPSNNPTSSKPRVPGHVYENGDETGELSQHHHQHLHLQGGGSQGKPLSQQQQQQQNRLLYCEKSSDSGISVCTNSPPPLRNEFRN